MSALDNLHRQLQHRTQELERVLITDIPHLDAVDHELIKEYARATAQLELVEEFKQWAKGQA